MTLHIAKNGPAACPWTVHITDGPAAGHQVGTSHARKRDAQAWIDAHSHLPWHQVHPTVQDATRSADLIVTVYRPQLDQLLDQLRHTDYELAVARQALLQYNGSGAAVDQARREIPRPWGLS